MLPLANVARKNAKMENVLQNIYIGNVRLLTFGSIILKRTDYVDSDDEIDDDDNDTDTDNDNGNTNTKWIDLTRILFSICS